MAGSALLWNNGAYMFGNADQDSLANQNGQGDAILDAENERQAKIQSNKDSLNADVTVDGENPLLKKKVCLILSYLFILVLLLSLLLHTAYAKTAI